MWMSPLERSWRLLLRWRGHSGRFGLWRGFALCLLGLRLYRLTGRGRPLESWIGRGGCLTLCESL